MSVWRTLSQVARYVSGEAAEDDGEVEGPMMESLASFQRHFDEDGGADAAGKERKVAAEDKTGKSAAEKWEVFSSLDLSKYVGKDVLSVASLPIWLFEPTTTLQRIGEIFEHGHRLLVLADNEPDPAMRMAYVAAFAVANYAGSERTLKPFNPILGETFECVGELDNNFTLARPPPPPFRPPVVRAVDPDILAADRSVAIDDLPAAPPPAYRSSFDGNTTTTTEAEPV